MGHAMMASHSKAGSKPVTPEGEPNSYAIDQLLQNLTKFRNFYLPDRLQSQQCLAITKAIIELTDLLGGLEPR